MPPFFQDILDELACFERELGGVKNFEGRPRIEKKVKASDFRSEYTDFEYVYLTILGFARLHVHCEAIVQRNNSRKFTQNPAVELLEQRTGMTMHADRPGANHLLRSAPACLVEAFAVARKDRHGMAGFFREAFDRTADPCLEGRAGRVMEYLQARSQVVGLTSAGPNWEELSLQPLSDSAKPEDVVGEHLRVFVNECTWRWAKERGVDYATAKVERQTETAALDFAALCNADAFEATLLARGIVGDAVAKQWEVVVDDRGGWKPYSSEQNEAIEMSQLQGIPRCEIKVRSWKYQIDFQRMVQVNMKTGKERPVRCVENSVGQSVARGRISHADLKRAVALFVELDTLAVAPGRVPQSGSPEAAMLPQFCHVPTDEGELPPPPPPPSAGLPSAEQACRTRM